MTQSPRMGDNRTGIGADPEQAEAMMQVTEELARPTSSGVGGTAEVHADYAREAGAIGSIPRSGARGEDVPESLAPLIDRLGARLAFERTSTRLYEALIRKLDGRGGFAGGPGRRQLARIREEKREHFAMLRAAVLELGGDPTALTPSADIESMVGRGVGDVVSDPRTTLLEGLEALLVAELADRESWKALTEIAGACGRGEMAERLLGALWIEEDHLEALRGWVAAGQRRGPP